MKLILVYISFIVTFYSSHIFSNYCRKYKKRGFDGNVRPCIKYEYHAETWRV